MTVVFKTARRFVTERLRRVNPASKVKNMKGLRSKLWGFLTELEGEMKKWVKGVELEVVDIIRDAGYEVEVHEAVTDDGYILQLHRLPARGAGHGHPVYIQHGLLCSSACWVTSGPRSLGFVLNDLGYDVWLGNFRGNAYGRKHTHLDPDKDAKFWKYTIHEHGKLDLPAGLLKCLSVTGKRRVSYIGHSMGTTSFLAMCSTASAPVLDNIAVAILLAPVVEPYTMTFPLKHVAPLAAHPWFAYSFESVGVQEFLPNWALIRKLVTAPWLQAVYAILLRNRFDEEATQIMKKISNTFRTGRTSIYTFFHYSQMICNKNFQAYNWTKEAENVKRYEIPQPPLYSLSDVNVPTVIFWSNRDSFASISDVERLQRELPHVQCVHKVDLCHIDYLWGEKAEAELYRPIGDILAKLES